MKFSDRHSLYNLVTALVFCLDVALFLALFFGAVGYFESDFWFLDLGVHFRAHYLAVAAISFLIHLKFKRWVLLVSLLTFMINFPPLIEYLPIAATAPQKAAGELRLRVMNSNLFFQNSHMKEFAEVVFEQNPDILVLQEYTSFHEHELVKMLNGYNYQVREPREDCFGIAVYSKHPLIESKVFQLELGQPPLIEAAVNFGDQIVKLFAVHPLPPAGEAGFLSRNKFLELLASHIQREIKGAQTNYLVIGDLNITMWSQKFTKLLARAKLKDTRAGFGIFPTWGPFSQPLGIPIDHILSSQALSVKNFRTSPIQGSDHLAITAELELN